MAGEKIHSYWSQMRKCFNLWSLSVLCFSTSWASLEVMTWNFKTQFGESREVRRSWGSCSSSKQAKLRWFSVISAAWPYKPETAIRELRFIFYTTHLTSSHIMSAVCQVWLCWIQFSRSHLPSPGGTSHHSVRYKSREYRDQGELSSQKNKK